MIADRSINISSRNDIQDCCAKRIEEVGCHFKKNSGNSTLICSKRNIFSEFTKEVSCIKVNE